MSDTPMTGGNRRIDQVLATGFADDLGGLDTEEVRRRRDLARSEREYLSFLRRLLQGRRDLLRDEIDRRRTGGAARPVVERVVSVLSEGSRGPSRGEAPVVSMPEDEVVTARRRVERLVSDARLSNLDGLSDDELEDGADRIDAEEREVSDARGRVMEVHDVLQEEMKRRLRAELGNPAS
jgi:anti-sigma-K factor RsiG